MKYTIGRKHGRKAVKVTLIVIAAAAVVLYAVGLTLGRNSEARTAVSEAVRENMQLKGELAVKDERINELDARVRELEEQAALVPTQAPAPYTPAPAVSAAPEPTADARSPRE